MKTFKPTIVSTSLVAKVFPFNGKIVVQAKDRSPVWNTVSVHKHTVLYSFWHDEGVEGKIILDSKIFQECKFLVMVPHKGVGINILYMK